MLYDDDEGKKFNEGTVSVAMSFRSSSVNVSPSQVVSPKQDAPAEEGGSPIKGIKSKIQSTSTAQELAKLTKSVMELQAYPDYYNTLPGPTVMRVTRV
jgi:hypothetical protein